MIYIIADLPENIESLEKQPLLNVINNFKTDEFNYKVLFPTLVPFFRYLASEYNFLDDEHFEYVFNHIQNIQLKSGTPLTMNDLELPNGVEKIYTRNNVLLYKNNERFGEVNFNRFGFISSVKYFWNQGSRVDIYSDYGVVTSSNIFDRNENLENQIFYDEQRQSIFEINHNQVNIFETASENFAQGQYSKLEDVKNEFLKKELKNFNFNDDFLVIDIANEYLMRLIQDFPFPERIIFVFYGQTSQSVLNKIVQIPSLNKAKAFITDTPLIKNTLDRMNVDAVLIPAFPTKLTLGQSNTLAERIIYWQIDNVDVDFKKVFYQMLMYRLKFDDLRLIINCKNKSDMNILNDETIKFVNSELEINTDSDYFKLVEAYYSAEFEGQIPQILRDSFNDAKKHKDGFQKIINAYLFINHIEYRYHSKTQIIQNDLALSRVYVNYRRDDDPFKESIVTSNGIPFISFNQSIYFEDKKNGQIINFNDELFEMLSKYLNSNEEWNKSLVESIDFIQKNASEKIMTDWREVIDG